MRSLRADLLSYSKSESHSKSPRSQSDSIPFQFEPTSFQFEKISSQLEPSPTRSALLSNPGINPKSSRSCDVIVESFEKDSKDRRLPLINILTFIMVVRFKYASRTQTYGTVLSY